MKKNYKYLMILTFILNFTNIYSQSNNYIYTWYNESIGTLYIDKQLLESSANIFSQYLGPIAPIILENLPYIISFFALFFIFRRFLNIINSQASESHKIIIPASISIVLTYYFWPFVVPISIAAFIIKVFRVGKSKLESFKETLGKINPRLPSIFSRVISNIKDFDKDTDKILKDINKLDKIINHPYIRNLLNSIEKDIENLNNIISQLLKETENKKLTQHRLKVYLLKFNRTYDKAISETKQLNRIINNMFSNYSFLRRFGNKIFRTNKFTPKYLMELRNILKDLNARLNNTYKDGQKTFAYLNGLLNLVEAINRRSETEINNDLKGIPNNKALLLLGNNKPLIREIQKVKSTIIAIDNNPNKSPFEKAEILLETRKYTKKLSGFLRKFKGDPKKLLKYYKKTIGLIRGISRISRKR
jgi:hypothetical protein